MEDESYQIRRRVRRGAVAGFACYVLWGLFPMYWKLLGHVSSFEVIAHRIIWCFVFTALICAIMRLDFMALLRDRRARRFLVPASSLITVNWSVFIFAVDIGRIVETSIGYYITPLFSILLGMVMFSERLSAPQWVAVALCCVGIGFFTVNYGQFPWISIVLAVTFGLYGAVKKKGGYPAVEAIAVESAVMAPVAIAFSIGLALVTGTHGFLGDVATAEGWTTTALLIGGGAVTALPLILFATAANSIPLTLLGFLQYVSPTISLLLGVLVYSEPFTLAHAVCFGCIWCGLALVGIDSVRAARKTPPGELTPFEEEEKAEVVR